MTRGIPLILLGMALVTYLPRFLPMAVLSRWHLPGKVRQGLEYIPVAILSAIVFPVLFFNDPGAFGMQARSMLSALAVFVFAWKVRSIWVSVVLGMAVYWMLGIVL